MSGCHSTITAARQCGWRHCVLNMLLPSMHCFDFLSMLLDLKGTFQSVPRQPAIFAFVKALPCYKWRKTQRNHFQFLEPTFKNEDHIQNAWGLGYLICSISLPSAREIAWFWCANVGNYTQIILKMIKNVEIKRKNITT